MKPARNMSGNTNAAGRKNPRFNRNWNRNEISVGAVNTSNNNNGNSGSGSNNNGNKGHFSGFSAGDESVNRLMNDRYNYLLVNSIGQEAIVTSNSGAQYKGLIMAINGGSVVLGAPKFHENIVGGDANVEELPKTLIFEDKDMMELEILGLDLEAKTSSAAASVSKGPVGNAGKFKTDTDISGELNTKERELQKWVPDASEDATLGGLGSFDDSGKPWDQFAVNEKKFGVQSSWNEELYTTKLDKSAPDYLEHLKEAEKVAREIEQSSYNGNVHLAEERGVQVDDSGLDEEDKYSGVDRGGSETDKRGSELLAALKINGDSAAAAAPAAPKKYVPPRQRNEVQNLDPAIISSMKQRTTGRRPDDSRMSTRQEINALREFSQNFKIPQKFPVEKPKESPKKPAVSLPAKPETISDKLGKPASTSNSDVAVAPEHAKDAAETKKDSAAEPKPKSTNAPVVQKKKMDPKAPAFKLNPQSASFTPMGSSPIRAYTNLPVPVQKPREITNAAQFFNNKVPKANRKMATVDTEFNYFLGSKTIERSFSTPPTWDATVDISYLDMFPGEMPVMGNNIYGAPMMFGAGGMPPRNAMYNTPQMMNMMNAGMMNMMYNPAAAAAAGGMPMVSGPAMFAAAQYQQQAAAAAAAAMMGFPGGVPAGVPPFMNSQMPQHGMHQHSHKPQSPGMRVESPEAQMFPMAPGSPYMSPGAEAKHSPKTGYKNTRH